jgi:peptidyl-prolyl cis-trans isomerase A (cyclophilin A)
MKRAFILATIIWALACMPATAGTIVNFKVSGLSFDVELYDADAPLTVANFLNYVNAGAYDNSIIHRSTTYNAAQVQVIQGGAYAWNASNQLYAIPTSDPVINEPGLLNERGTIAMAKLGGDPDSATSQWFFNVQDNPNLDLPANNGGFTVFGHVTDAAGLAAIDAIAGLYVAGQYQLPDLPPELVEAPLIQANNQVFFVTVDSVAVVPEPSAIVLATVGIGIALSRRRK